VTGKKPERHRARTAILLGIWAALALAGYLIHTQFQDRLWQMQTGWTIPQMLALLAGIFALGELLALITHGWFAFKHRPPVEGAMVGRIYMLAAMVAVLTVVLYGFGRSEAFGAFFAMFGGMFLGMSLQAPVSGFAAWLLVSLKRPFRPGDRIQFPGLGLVGDVQDMGVMYTVLDQVGGSVGSEEAVGRGILVPNAMLFGQVVINYTVTQDAPYMLDEVVARITYDSDWEAAEKILMDAAMEVTKDIIKATGEKPYIRSDMWDYGVLMRLRFKTRVKDRTEISYHITKLIFETVQKTPSVDVAIPFIYSYRAGMDRKEGEEPSKNGNVPPIREIPLELVECAREGLDPKVVEGLAKSIAAQGLLQPIVVIQKSQGGRYEVLAGHIRFEACRKLGWKSIPAVVRETREPAEKEKPSEPPASSQDPPKQA
jgi:small-conductance mechanosensitive channel